jgi:hypothetical protein
MRSQRSPWLLVAVGLLTISLYRLAAPHLPAALATDFAAGLFHGVGIGLELLGLGMLARRGCRSGC